MQSIVTETNQLVNNGTTIQEREGAHAMVDMFSLGNQVCMWWWISLLVVIDTCLYSGCDDSATLH